MDLHLHGIEPTDAERAAVDACLGAPASGWDGGLRVPGRDGHVGYGGHAVWARRHELLPALHAVQARVGWISEGALDYVCTRLGIPPADAWGVATFYALFATTPRPRRVIHVCDDIACRCRGAGEIAGALEAAVGPALAHAPEGDHVLIGEDDVVWMRSPCLGYCDHAPAALYVEAGERPVETLMGEVSAADVVALARENGTGGTRHPERSEGPAAGQRQQQVLRFAQDDVASSSRAVSPEPRAPNPGVPALGPRLLTARIGVVDPTSLDAYRAAGGYEALRRALDLGPEGVIREVTESKLVGRGGAAFPTGRKWDAVARQPARPHYLVCNADESEPGTFKDRVLMEGDPFAIVEAMTIAGVATGCERGFLYLRGEYPLANERMRTAIDQARARGLLGDDVMGRGVAFDIEIRRGAGAYICGEETALLNSIEGYRGEPRNKPPFPVQPGGGLFGKPTVINNVETLANVLPILQRGGAAYARTGTAQSTGTRLFCLSGRVARPGVYEVESGTPLRALLDTAGGVPDGRAPTAILLGGAAGGFVRPDELDIPLSMEGARAANATLGSGVVMVFDDSVDLGDVLLRIAAFFRDESCGQCVPCRVGTVRQEEALHRIACGKTRGGVTGELALLAEVGQAMRDASICGLGQTASSAVESAIGRLRIFE